MNQRQKTYPSEIDNKRPANDLSNIIKRNWYWFVISVIICMSLALLCITYCPHVYTRTASVLIKDNCSGRILNQSSEYPPIEIKKNIGNEASIFKSKQLMLKVVKRLNLYIDYTINEGLFKTELYAHSPVIVSFPNASETDQFSFVATPISKNKIQLSCFSNNKSDIIIVNLKENNIASTPLGNIVVNPSIYYGDKYFDIPITITKKNIEEVARYYSDKLSIRIQERSASVIKISLDDKSVTRNEEIINTLIAIYNEEAVNDKTQIFTNTLDFIDKRMLAIKNELDNTDIDTVKPKNMLTDVHPATGLYINNNNTLSNQEITDSENRKILARNISDYILDPKRSSDLIPAYTISDSNIEKQITEYNNLILRRSKLIASNKEENQDIKDLNKSLTLMKQNIIRDIGNFILRTDSKIRNIRQLESEKVSAVTTRQIQILPLESDLQQKNKESLYFYLSKKREDTMLLQAMADSDIQIIDLAKGSERPTSPNTILVILAAIIAGIALPAIMIWLRTVSKTTVRNRKDVEDILSIPVLGDIPLLKKNQPGKIVVREDSHEPISEAFRMIRTNIDFMNNKAQGSQVIMLTSFVPRAGKTFVSANLAMSFALIRKKVILVDLDMRKGTLSSYINKNYSGISTFLSGKINDINKIITKKVFYDTLDFIPAGPIPQNPSELLLSNRFDILIQDLKKHYDYIILDNATSNVVADPTIVNRISDLALFVIRADKTDRRQLPELEKQCRNNKYNNMKIILNGINYKQFGHGYYEYYNQK